MAGRARRFTPAPPPSVGPLDGRWQASTGATFKIDDDGKTAKIDLVTSSSLQTMFGDLKGREENPDATVLTGKLRVIFKSNPGTPYTIPVTRNDRR